MLWCYVTFVTNVIAGAAALHPAPTPTARPDQRLDAVEQPLQPELEAVVEVVPLTMLANTFVAPELMPGWLGTVAEWNPLSATVSATRELFGNPGSTSGSWIAEHALLMAVVWPLTLLAVFVPLAVRRYRRLQH